MDLVFAVQCGGEQGAGAERKREGSKRGLEEGERDRRVGKGERERKSIETRRQKSEEKQGETLSFAKIDHSFVTPVPHAYILNFELSACAIRPLSWLCLRRRA